MNYDHLNTAAQKRQSENLNQKDELKVFDQGNKIIIEFSKKLKFVTEIEENYIQDEGCRLGRTESYRDDWVELNGNDIGLRLLCAEVQGFTNHRYPAGRDPDNFITSYRKRKFYPSFYDREMIQKWVDYARGDYYGRYRESANQIITILKSCSH